MSLRDKASKILSGTPSGTNPGTECPTASKLSQTCGTAGSGNIGGFTGKKCDCPSVPNIGNGTVGHLLKSGTPCGTERGTPTLLDWYLSHRDTLNPDDDLTDYRNSKLSEPMELVDLILKEKSDYWMRTNGDLEHCLGIIMRHVEAGHA